MDPIEQGSGEDAEDMLETLKQLKEVTKIKPLEDVSDPNQPFTAMNFVLVSTAVILFVLLVSSLAIIWRQHQLDNRRRSHSEATGGSGAALEKPTVSVINAYEPR